MYNYNHLYYFYITVKTGGVTSAAKHLTVSQPSLSSQLKVLERALDLRLFQKVGRVNELTREGAFVYGFCRRMFELSEEMSEELTKRVPSATRRIRIGVSDEVDRPFVADIVSLFLRKHGMSQRPKVNVVSGKREELLERLRLRELDAVVTELAVTEPELVNLERAEVPVVLTASRKWKGSGKLDGTESTAGVAKKLISSDDMQWVMPSAKFKLRSEIDRFFDDNELKGRIVFESDMMASLVRSVIDEIGLSFFPLLYVAREIREKSLRIVGPKTGFWKYRVWLACHNQNKEDAVVQTLAASFTEICLKSL